MKKTAETASFAEIVFATLIVITPIVVVYTFVTRAQMDTYRTEGIEVSATVHGVTEVWQRRYTTYRADTAFFTKTNDVDDIGNMITVEITQFLNRETADDLREREQVVYLPDDPEKAVFKKSLDPAYYSPLQRWSTTVYLAIGTFVSALWMMAMKKK